MAERHRLGWLLVLAAVPAAVEAAVLVAVGLQSARPLAPQVTAVWPYDSYHDLRWLLVYHDSWSSFLLGLLAVVVLRGLLSAGLTALAWPTGVPRPSWRWLLRRNIEVAALAAVIISPWAALSVAFSVVALSWYLLASLLPMLLVSPFLQRAGVAAHWWRGLPSLALLGWSSLNFVVLTLAGALIAATPGWADVLLAGLAGLVNGLLWRQTVHAAVQPARIRWARVPVAPLMILVVVFASVAAQGAIGLAVGGHRQWDPPVVTQRLPDRVRHTVIVLAGHDSSWDGTPPADPRVVRYSYLGLDDQRRPRPYGPHATHRTLGSSAALLAEQIDEVHRRTRRPVALVGQSEGAMVISTYLETLPQGSPVDTALLFSPLIRPGRAYYPPPGHSGWGVAAGWELRLLFGASNLFREVDSNPDEPFVRSVLAEAPFYRNRTLCPVAGVRMIAFLPTVSAVEAPPGEYSGIPVYKEPAFHGGLLGRHTVQDRLVDFIAGDQVEQARDEYDLLQRTGAAWQAPELLLSLNPIWSTNREADPARTGRICEGR
ncbi:hypothetical protein ACFFMR_14745 [Micromonospora andamanensis]|uniref:Alpha/beta hydrolase n=1 Tax=Micromonospora andamanensis TaxID=1287068 RepID=A0ABQ4I104_9ACTN|nr:hypothetical protein [Micromonospora andamanensis]GIJ11557.1 hypothetical protein Van01_47710 [Micromonospora andamanensis]